MDKEEDDDDVMCPGSGGMRRGDVYVQGNLHAFFCRWLVRNTMSKLVD